MINHETPETTAGQLIVGGFEVPTTPEWFHEPDESEGYRPWQHTPLDPYGEQVRGHQAALREELGRLAITVPPQYRKRRLRRLVELDFMSGLANRETASAANFTSWVTNHPEEIEAMRRDPDVAWILGEGLAGHGSARGQLEILRRAPSLLSLDLQALSTPYGYRREHLPAMHRELYEALQAVGAMIYDEPQWIEGHEPKIATDPTRLFRLDEERHDEGRGLLVTFKRAIAVVPDIANPEGAVDVLERQAWLVLTDEESGFSQEISQMMWRNPAWYEPVKPKDADDTQQPERTEAARQICRYIMKRIDDEIGCIPLSVATYARRANN